MSKLAPIARLVEIAGSFGPTAATGKLALLRAIADTPRHGARDLAALQDALGFLRAYPDDARVLRAVIDCIARLRNWLDAAGGPEAPALVDTGFPGSEIFGELSLPLLERLGRSHPGAVEIDWQELEDEERLVNTIGLFTTSAECQGLDDVSLPLADWFAACRPVHCTTDLDFLISLFRNSTLDRNVRDHTFESVGLPLRYSMSTPGTGRSEVTWPVDRVHYQRKELDRTRLPLETTLRRPFSRRRLLGAATGARMIQVAQLALCSRGLEIRTLSNANARDVTLVACGRGLEIALIGVAPHYRDPLECHYCCLLLKNGVPIAYGPSTVSLGCSEIGINMFPEFRGAEIRFVYPQFMRALHQVQGTEHFFLTRYGMGEGNPAAIRTGAFWFYRKLGFRPTNPAVEALARKEEARMRRDPAYRSSRSILRRLSHTEAYLDLSGGECRPLDLGAIGTRQSRFVAEAFDGDRVRALQRCMGKVARSLGAATPGRSQPEARRAWEMLAPLLARIPDLASWTARDKKRLLRILRLKGGASELEVDRAVRAHTRLCAALREL